MVLDKNSLIKAAKLKTVEVEVEGGKVCITEITQSEYDGIINDPANKTESGDQNWHKTMTALIMLSVLDAKGGKMFEGDADAEIVAGFTRTVREALTNACLKANGLKDDPKPLEPTGDGSTTGE